MTKKEIKEKIKSHFIVAEDNETELKTIEILNVNKNDTKISDNNFRTKSVDSKGVLNLSDTPLLTQDRILKNVNLYTREKAFSLSLENGPYNVNYTQNGTHLLVRNQSGSISAFNTQHLSLSFDIDVFDKVYDAKWLHNEHYFAAAQENALYIYNHAGVELHAVRDIVRPRMLEFLPYHFLLSTVNDNARMKYLDTSMGTVIADLFIKDKNIMSMKAGPTTGVMYLGGSTGTVSLWAPSQNDFLMKVNCHSAGVTNIEIDRTGSKLITTGLDNKLNIHDMRNTYKPLKTVKTKTNIHKTALSQMNMLAISHGNKVTVLKDFEMLYTKERMPGVISSLEFCSHEDILAVGHEKGITTLVVPGCGDPIYDSNECSPFMTKQQRQSLEVKRLLEKVPYDMISLNSVLGEVVYKNGDKVGDKDNKNERYFNNNDNNTNALSRFRENRK